MIVNEVANVLYAVKLKGSTLYSNLPSRTVAENMINQLAPEQRQYAEVVVIASDGKQALFG